MQFNLIWFSKGQEKAAHCSSMRKREPHYCLVILISVDVHRDFDTMVLAKPIRYIVYLLLTVYGIGLTHSPNPQYIYKEYRYL